MELYFKGVSSTENDDDLKKHVRKFFRRHRYASIDEIPHTTQYTKGDEIALDENQLTNLYGNIQRIVCCILDDEDKKRKLASLAFEDKIKSALDSQGVQYVDEIYLQKVNRKRQKEGKPSLPTPDFLLKTPISVRGEEIHWIECKNYYGTTIPKLVNRLGFVKTAKKYKNKYGNGIMAFHFGFNKDLEQVEGVMYADLYDRE